MECHISAKKVNKANSLFGMIRRTFLHLDKENFKLLFTSIVRPHLEYANSVWNPQLKRLINMVENVQRRATKCIPGLSNLTYKERLEILDLPTLQYRRYRGDMIEVFKCAHLLYDNEVLNDFLTFKCNEGHNLRGHRYRLNKVLFRKDVRKHAFTARVTNQWNNLPDHITGAPTINIFKNRLDRLWKKDNLVMFDP